MFDIKWIRENAAEFDAGLGRRGLEPQSSVLIALDDERRAIIGKLQEAQTSRNAASKEIGKAMAGKDLALAVPRTGAKGARYDRAAVLVQQPKGGTIVGATWTELR